MVGEREQGDTNSKKIPLVKIVGCGCWKINSDRKLYADVV